MCRDVSELPIYADPPYDSSREAASALKTWNMRSCLNAIICLCRDNITLTAQERDPHAISTHIASWITIVLPFAKVSSA